MKNQAIYQTSKQKDKVTNEFDEKIGNNSERLLPTLRDTTKELLECYLPYFEKEGEESFKKSMELVRELHYSEYELIYENVVEMLGQKRGVYEMRNFFSVLNYEIKDFAGAFSVIAEYLDNRRPEFVPAKVHGRKNKYIFREYEKNASYVLNENDKGLTSLYFYDGIEDEPKFIIPMPTTKLSFLLIMDEIDNFIK